MEKNFYGPSTLRKGIEYSRNLMTVRICKNFRVRGNFEFIKKTKHL